MIESKKTTDDVLRFLIKISKRARQLGSKAVVLTSQLSKMGSARDVAELGRDEVPTKVSTLGARVRLLCDELDSLNRCELTKCDLKVISCRVADAQGDFTNLAT